MTTRELTPAQTATALEQLKQFIVSEKWVKQPIGYIRQCAYCNGDESWHDAGIDMIVHNDACPIRLAKKWPGIDQLTEERAAALLAAVDSAQEAE